ncbi:hypothetical protein [Bacillus marasmi]|uniref:hypothetical protein n=1 Tax=Bacillus marasmi TaxID=1926279 RepID=UPI0011CB6813|nr:hypothetical protein [Bacillus marasmi]
MFFNFGRTTYERKRDEYYKLYQKLGDALLEHDKHVREANSANCTYINSVPNLSNSKIPSGDFDTKREELTAKLNSYFIYDLEKRTDIITATDKAYQRYIYYKNLAIKEAAEEAKRAEEAKKAKSK